MALFLGVAVFISTCQALFLECDFYSGNYGEPIGELYACSARANLADNNSEKLTAVIGNHAPQKTNANVKALYVMGPDSSVGIDRLPSGISRFLPKLVILGWENAGLKHLSQDDFKPFPNLIQAGFGNNLIKQLDGNLFQSNPKLQKINFSYNAIQVIGKGFFDGLKDLTEINFRNNQCFSSTMMHSSYIERAKAELLWLCSSEEN